MIRTEGWCLEQLKIKIKKILFYEYLQRLHQGN